MNQPAARLPLSPGADGNFTVAHGLGRVPVLVLIQMTSGGGIWFQPAMYDAKNIYLVAAASEVSGVALCWTD